MNAPYLKLSNKAGEQPGSTVAQHRADPGLACWAALVHAWDGLDAELDEADTPGVDPDMPLTDVRKFG